METLTALGFGSLTIIAWHCDHHAVLSTLLPAVITCHTSWRCEACMVMPPDGTMINILLLENVCLLRM